MFRLSTIKLLKIDNGFVVREKSMGALGCTTDTFFASKGEALDAINAIAESAIDDVTE